MTLAEVETFDLPLRILDETDEALRSAGRKGCELFVLWSGILDGKVFQCRTTHVPEQSAYHLESGLLVRVEADALHALNVWLFENNEVLAVQVHAHPTDAYHSDTDDTYPIVTTLGGLSLVAPYFAKEGLLRGGTAAYRLGMTGWRHLPPSELRSTLRLVE